MIALDSEAKEALKNETAITRHFEITMPGVFSGSINQYLIKESVRFSERMCSTDSLEFGLCEANGIEFEYFGLPPVAIGARIYVQYNFTVHGHSGFYEIPIGYFTVKSCVKNMKIGSYKVTAYNRLADAKFNENVHYILTKYLSENFAKKYINMYSCMSKIHDYLDIDDSHALNLTTKSLDGFIGLACDLDSKEWNMEQQEWTSRWYEKFTQLYGISSFFNPYMAGLPFNSNQEVNMQISYYCYEYRTLDPNKYYKVTINPRLKSWNASLKELIIEHLKRSKIITLDRNDPSYAGSTETAWREILGRLYNYYEWHGIWYGLSSGFVQFACRNAIYEDSEHRSLLGWDDYYELYTDDSDAQKVSGSFEDASSVILTGFNSIYLAYPTAMSLYQGNMPFGGNIYFTGSSLLQTFQYYNNYGSLETGSYMLPRSSDGAWIGDGGFGDIITVEEITNLTDIEKLNISMDGLKSVPAREFIASEYELDCTYGIVDRVTDEFIKRELDYDALFPAESLYPANGLYPDGDNHLSADHVTPTQYERLWIEPGMIKKFRTLYADYSKIQENGEQRILTKTKTINNDNSGGNVDYYMSNEILTNAENVTDDLIQSIVDGMYQKMKNLSWVPFELRCVGLPYLEVGDKIEINDGTETRVTYILQRELRGIHYLNDTIINGNLDIY